MPENIETRNRRYNAYVERVVPKTSAAKSLAHSFLVGGTTCVIGQIIYDVYELAMPDKSPAQLTTYMLCTIIAAAILLTGIGVFDRIGRFAGAGAFLPITGFANAMASAAMEFKTEGLVLGSQTKFFSVVGPVIVNGVVWSALAGLIRYVIFVATGGAM
jgi:stage V sporulation protein AC